MKKLSMNRYRLPYKKGIFIILVLISRAEHTLQLNGWKKELLIDEELVQLSYRRNLTTNVV